MSDLIIISVLWIAAAILGWMAWRRRDGTFAEGLIRGGQLAVFMAPRMVLGSLAALSLAAILPREAVGALIGPTSGSLGIAIASLIGGLTPGGPLVAIAIGASALEAGGGTAQVIAYLTAWSVFSPNRLIVFELPLMGRRLVLDRLIVSWPLPFAAGHVALLF